jgi:RNA polymerase sigma-70 factor (ECF subfamily)
VYSRSSAFVHAFFRGATGIESRDAMAKSDSTLVLPAILDIEPGIHEDVEAEVLALFDECGAPLIRYVGAFGVNAPDTEDVVQDVFLSLFRHVQLGRPRTNLRGWLFRVAHNLALKQRLRTKRRQAIETTVTTVTTGTTGTTVTTGAPNAARAAGLDNGPNPEQQLASLERRQRLLAVFRALPERDRRCLSLRAEGLRYREIADALGLSLGGVAKSLARSMTRMVNADER